jgi:hypothetical protein
MARGTYAPGSVCAGGAVRRLIGGRRLRSCRMLASWENHPQSLQNVYAPALPHGPLARSRRVAPTRFGGWAGPTT